MPDSDPSHTASTDPRKEELASLFRQWEGSGAADGQAKRVARTGIALRAVVTLVLAIAAAFVMNATKKSVSFWAEPSAPRQHVDLRDDFVRSGGAQDLEPGHVELGGLVPTRIVAVEDQRLPDSAPGKRSYLFFCPLRWIVVLTQQEIRIDPAMAAGADKRLERLVIEKKALPEETAASATISGRLVPANEAPAELQPFVQSFAQRMQRGTGDLWVLIGGAHPSDSTWALIVWILAAAAPLLSLAFLVRAVRHQRRIVGAPS